MGIVAAEYPTAPAAVDCPEALFGFWLDLSGEVTIAVEYRTAPAAVDCPTALFGFWLDLLVGHAMT